MTLFQKFTTLVDAANGKSRHLLTSASLIEAFTHLDRITDHLKELKGKTEPKNAFAAWGMALAALENRSKQEDQQPWRFVFDTPIANGTYVGDPVVQICSGEPDYHRLVMTFTSAEVTSTFDINCIDPNPNLSTVISKNSGPDNLSMYALDQINTPIVDLGMRKQQDEEAGIQRIAILGAARVFSHGEQANPNHIALTKHVQRQCNLFLDVFEDIDNRASSPDEEPTSPFRTVNGGWAGKLEGSTGLPLISNLVGQIENKKFKREPITIMPSSGAYDRVEGVGDANYFEVPGTWGDDSKYLVGFCSAAIIFEPYGFWTGIELTNAVAQGKPVVVIRGPGTPSQAMEQIDVMLPGAQNGTYRKYSNLSDASVWIKHFCNTRFLDTFQQKHPLLSCNDSLDDLKRRYIDNEIGFKALVEQAINRVPSETRRALSLALVQQHGKTLKFLPEEERNNTEIIISAIQQNPEAINFVSPSLGNYEQMQSLASIQWTPTRIDRCKAFLQVEAETLITKLTIYKDQRSANPDEYYYFGFFNCWGGYSKTQKLDAVTSLIQCLRGDPGKKLSTEQLNVLHQGALGTLVKGWERESGWTINSFVGEEPRPSAMP